MSSSARRGYSASLTKETRLQTDDDATADRGDNSDSVSPYEVDDAGVGRGADEGLGRGADTTTPGGRRGIDGGDWRLEANDLPDG